MKDEIITSIQNGKITKGRNDLIKALSKHEGKEILITIEKLSRKRTNQQNRYIHKLFSIFTSSLNDLGNDFLMSEVKSICAAKFLVEEKTDLSTGEILQRVRGTSELKTYELNEYFENIIAWAADTFGIILPLPNEDLNEINKTNLKFAT